MARLGLSVPGLSIGVLFLSASFLLAFAAVWLSAVPPAKPIMGMGLLLLVAGRFGPYRLVSVFISGPLLVVSTGTRDTYLAPEDIRGIEPGPALGPFRLLTIVYQGSFLGRPLAKRARTLIWRKSAAKILHRLEEFLGEQPSPSVQPQGAAIHRG